jgi:hypothetical protein
MRIDVVDSCGTCPYNSKGYCWLIAKTVGQGTDFPADCVLQEPIKVGATTFQVTIT